MRRFRYRRAFVVVVGGDGGGYDGERTGSGVFGGAAVAAAVVVVVQSHVCQPNSHARPSDLPYFDDKKFSPVF